MADFFSILLRKAGVIVCLFLLPIFSEAAPDNLWQFDPALQHIHLLIMNLQTAEAATALSKLPATANPLQKIYLQSLTETVNILITEDEKKFDAIEAAFKKRLKYLEELPADGETKFLEAELNLQLGFNYLNLGQELNAVLAIRRAYNLALDCQKKYPAFIPIRKTAGVIQVMVGSVPEKYKWFMGLLGMKGSVTEGQKQLQQLKTSSSSLNVEATVLFFTIKGFINQKFDEAAKGLQEYLQKEPDNRLVMFLAINMLIKNSQSEEAFSIMQTMDKQSGGLPVYYIEYLRGEVLLQRGDYTSAITAYEKFIAGYNSLSFKKDSYFKISLCYWLQNKPTLAKANFEKAKKTGRDVAEPDRYAAQELEEPGFPNPKILRARFATDGGYYEEAAKTLQNIQPSDLKNLKEQTEFYYRKARLADKTGQIPAAQSAYLKTITMAGQNTWYFAPNSTLQLGYLAVSQKNYSAARKYFDQALSYKKYAYKNSIDSKAKSAIDALPKEN